MHFKQQRLNQNNVHIVCWVLFFLGCFVTAALSRMHVRKTSLCSDLLGGLEGGEQALTKGRWKRRPSLLFLMFCQYTVQNPAFQPALAKDSSINFRLCHGERKEDCIQAAHYGSSLLSSPYTSPQKYILTLLAFLSHVSLIIYTQALRQLQGVAEQLSTVSQICFRFWKHGSTDQSFWVQG